MSKIVSPRLVLMSSVMTSYPLINMSTMAVTVFGL